MFHKFFVKLRNKTILNAVRAIVREEYAGQTTQQLGSVQNQIGTVEQQLFVSNVQGHYQRVREKILTRTKKGEKLRFVSYVVYDTTFGAHGICALMLKEPQKYDVKFVICPDTYRDKDFSQYHKTKSFFTERYGAERVLDGYDETTGEFIDWSDACDVVYLANKYDVLVHKLHGIHYLSQQDVLPIHLNYGFNSTNYSLKGIEEQFDSCLYYKYFINTHSEKRDKLEIRIATAYNLVVSGYAKMDEFASIPDASHSRKKILLAPHHTVKGLPGTLQISNFLQYADFIPTLADTYPDIDFVFRPHPLLFTNLVMRGMWTQAQVDRYLSDLSAKNIVYSTEGDYFHLFRECDAIIHDCGSFMAEWLFTGKPCCYVIDSDGGIEKINSQLSREGKFALSKYHIADSEEKIKDFIEKVRTGSYGPKQDDDVKRAFMVNYPHVSAYIVKTLLD